MGAFDKIKNFWFTAKPSDFKQNAGAQYINRYIAPVQFYRIKQDIQEWRDAITEMENPILPYRVKVQRIFADTELNGHVTACMTKRKNLILLKDYALYRGEEIDEKATELIKKKYFLDIMNYTIDADFFGYSLIQLGDLDGDELKDVTLIKRENTSPDRLTVAPVTYSPSGSVMFMDKENKDENGQSFYDWSIYISTNSVTAQSKCGYGLLYKIAYYEIFLRNLMGYNSDYAEVYGQPLRHAKSPLTEGEEYDKLETALRDMASNPSIITDMQTEINFTSAPAGAGGHEVYSNLEERLEKKISKILLGHADALDSTAGKLGSNDEVSDSLRDIEKIQVREFEHRANTIIIPKLQNLGIKIPLGLTFKFKNDKEKIEEQENKDKSNLIVAQIAQTMKTAGLKMDAAYFEERTGIKATESLEEPIAPTNSIKNSLTELYGDA